MSQIIHDRNNEVIRGRLLIVRMVLCLKSVLRMCYTSDLQIASPLENSTAVGNWKWRSVLLNSGCYSVLEIIGKVHSWVISFNHDFRWDGTASYCSWGWLFICFLMCWCCFFFKLCLLIRTGWILLRAFNFLWPCKGCSLLIVVVLYVHILLFKEWEKNPVFLECLDSA